MELMGSATHLRRGYGAPSIEHVALGSRRIDGQAAEGRGAELGKRSINTSRSGNGALGESDIEGKAAMGSGE
jgi:hypothetical protein